VAAINALELRPDAVLVTGDLTDHATDEEYAQAREALAELEAPLHVLPGNRDDRSGLRRHFDVPGGGDGAPVQYAADVGPLRLVAVDSTRPGADAGELDADRLAWLDATLADAPDRPTVVAMHHPPVATGLPALDVMGVPPAHREALADVLDRHPQVRRVVGGHLHRMIAGQLGARPVLAVPSTYVQFKLDFEDPEIQLAPHPAGFAVHALVDGEVVSHVELVP
jgi:3',5'-cyclic AMP phosphodiesterase CpdA